MSDSRSVVVVREAYVAQYADPIAFRCGDEVQVERADVEFPEWFWCRGPDGKEGWVHRSFLSQFTGRAIGLSDYSARELSVSVGDRGRIIQVLDGWAYFQLEENRAGWLPERVLQLRPSNYPANSDSNRVN